jgi:hypothetical protein
VDISVVRISISGFGYCFSRLLKSHSVGSESSGAVSKLSCISVVSGSVSGCGVVVSPVVFQRLSLLNSSKLKNVGGVVVRPSIIRLLLRGSASSSGSGVCSLFGGVSLGALKTFLSLGGVSISGYLASWERRDVR